MTHRSRGLRAYTRACTTRRLFIVDIENLAGGDFRPETFRTAHRAVQMAVPPRNGDQTVIGTSHQHLLTVADTWPAVRYVVRSGPDGADLVLLDVLSENIEHRFAEAVICSGDHIFTPAARRLVEAGLRVSVVARDGALARELAAASHNVIVLPRAQAA